MKSPLLRKQKGIVMVLFTISMVVLLGMAGVALDGAHGMLNKTRLQNIVDSAALSGAKTLDQTNDVVLADADARAILATNAGDLGNAEIQGSLGGDLSVSVQFSSTLHPFVPGTSPERYVRVTAQNLRLPGWFIPVLGFAEKVVGASAVAGPSPSLNTTCNLVPMMVCGTPGLPASEHFGFELGVADVLKASNNSFEVGPGNFQLLRLGGGMGGNDIRYNMAGGFTGCIENTDTLETEPGNTVGPTVQGINTRFGQYSGPMGMSASQYPPDVIVQEPSTRLTYECDAAGGEGSDAICVGDVPLTDASQYYSHQDYKNALQSQNFDHAPIEIGGNGAFNRRTLAVPIGDCTNQTNGHGFLPMLGILCYHLIQTAEQHGNRSQIFGQFIESGCPTQGRPGPAPGSGPGPYIIQLYKDETADAS